MAYIEIDPLVIPNEPIVLTDADGMELMYKGMPINAVKSSDTIIAVSELTPDNAANGVINNLTADYTYKNKANTNFETAGTITKPTGQDGKEVPIPDTLIQTGSIDNTMFSHYTFDSGVQWHGTDGITMKKKGFASFWLLCGRTDFAEDGLFFIGESGFPSIWIHIERPATGEYAGNTVLRVYVEPVRAVPGTSEKTEVCLIAIPDFIVDPDDLRAFVTLSWENVLGGSSSTHTLKCGISATWYNETHWLYDYAEDTKTGNYVINETEDVYVYVDTNNNQPPYIYASQPMVHMGVFINQVHQTFNLARQYPLYPDDPTGIDYKTWQFDIVGAANPLDVYFVNQNIRFDRFYSPEQDTRPGRIVWTNQSNLISTNEYPINEDITAIMPFKSVQSTDEHNTLLIWAGNALKLMTFTDGIGNEPIDIEKNVGITSKYLFVKIPFGCVWAAPEGLRIMQDGKSRVVSKGRIEIDTIDAICYEPNTNSVYVISNTGRSYVYCISQDAFFEFESDILPSSLGNFIIHKDSLTFPAGTAMYQKATTDLPAEITLQDINVIKKTLLRMIDKTNLPSVITTFDAVVFNANGENDSIDQITTMTTNKNYQVPGLKGTPVQITFTPTTAIEAIEVSEK